MVLQEKLVDFDNEIVLQPANLVALFFPKAKDAAEAVEDDDAAADKGTADTATKQTFESEDTANTATKQTFESEDAAADEDTENTATNKPAKAKMQQQTKTQQNKPAEAQTQQTQRQNKPSEAWASGAKNPLQCTFFWKTRTKATYCPTFPRWTIWPGTSVARICARWRVSRRS